MEMKLGLAQVQHGEELATLFSSPTTARTEAKMLLSGIGEVPHFNRNQHTCDLLLSSYHGVVIGHLVDNHGYKCTDLMLLHMGLMAIGPGDTTNTLDLDIQYGT